MIHSDWHIHSEFSYDASLPLQTIIENAQKQGMRAIGITDHANFNDKKFMTDLRLSAENVRALQKDYPWLYLGVELTPIAKPEYDHIAKTGVRDGYVAPPTMDTPYGIELAATKEELIALGVRYAIGASHWRTDGLATPNDGVSEFIKEWYRQQLFMAADARVTILGHPWYNGKQLWYEDFGMIPRSMNKEIGDALLENGKYAECNPCMFTADRATEKFRHQYAEFLREWFEMGIPITFGSDSHASYNDVRPLIEPYLARAGFSEGDFSELQEKDLW